MLAGWAFLGCLGAFVGMTTVGAVPFHRSFPLEDFIGADVFRQFPVRPFMEFLYFGEFLEEQNARARVISPILACTVLG